MTDYTTVDDAEPGASRMDDSTQPVDSTRLIDSTQPIDATATTEVRPPTLPPPPPPRRRRGRIVLLVLIAALVAAALAYPAGQRATQQDASTPIAEAPVNDRAAVLDAPSPVPEIARTLLPSVAQVETPRGAGSAVIYRADGYLVTNNHVIADSDQVQVILADGQRRDAEIVGKAGPPLSDLAVLKIADDDLPAATFTDEIPEIGSTAVAMGSPFGLNATVTAGVVSATDRELQAGNESLGGLIQTDAAINPGNSGGALADDRGRIIGINTAILSGSGTSSGVGFAVPSASVVALADQLIERGSVTPGFLGIEGQPVSPETAEAFGVPEGAVIIGVTPDSGADEAGLRAEDVIVSLDGEQIDSMLGLSSRVIVHQPGDEITIGFVRNGQEREATVTLGERPAAAN
ncbi:trypsin-like peptidase domain-containing protein [soil metagenome]